MDRTDLTAHTFKLMINAKRGIITTATLYEDTFINKERETRFSFEEYIHMHVYDNSI